MINTKFNMHVKSVKKTCNLTIKFSKYVEMFNFFLNQICHQNLSKKIT